MKATVSLNGRRFEVELSNDDGWSATVDGQSFALASDGEACPVVKAGGYAFSIDPLACRVDGSKVDLHILALEGVAGAPSVRGAYGPIHAPMTGTLAELRVVDGQTVAQGDVLFVLEAMKMRNEIKATAAGVVASIGAAEGEPVDPRQPILVLEPVS